MAANSIEFSSPDWVSSLFPVADEGIDPPDPLSPARQALFPRLHDRPGMNGLLKQLSSPSKAKREVVAPPTQ